MLNKCQFIGSLGKDPEILNTNNGGRVAKMSIACSERWKDKKTGEKKELTQWIPVVVFNSNIVGVCEKYLRKGDKVYIDGMFQTRKWEDKNGDTRYSTEIVLQNFGSQLVLLSGKKEQAEQAFEEPTDEYAQSDDFSDDIPFN